MEFNIRNCENFKIKDLVKVNRGSSPRPIQKYLDTKGYKWLKISDFKLGDKFVNITKEFIKEEGLYNTRFVKKGTLILTNSATPGIPIFLGEDMCLHDGFLYFENLNEKKLNIEFLYCWFLLNRNYIINQANGTVFRNLKKEIIENLSISLPDIKIQNKIVKIYNSILDKIIINNKINDNLYKLGGNLFNKISKNLNESNSKLYVLKDVIELLRDGTHNPPKRIKNGVPLLMGQTIQNGFINYDKMTYISENDYKKIHSKYEPQKFDLLLTKIGTVGKVAILRQKDIPIAIHCNSALIRFNSKFISQFYGFWLLLSNDFQNEFKIRVTKTVQEFVSLGSISEIPIRVPNKEILTKYDTLFKNLLNKVSQINEENIKLEQLRDTLLPKLMNGEIDLDKIEI